MIFHTYVLQEKHPDICVPPMDNPTYAAFEGYEEVPEMVPLELSEEDFPWVSSKLSGAAGDLGAVLKC